MPTRNIKDQLNSGEVLLMDGGTGSEIQRRGANVLVETTAETELRGWSATANVEYADVVQQVHQDYLRVGADIIISNNFWATPHRLNSIGLEHSWEHYARAAGENALKAREAQNPEAYVLGGIAAPYTQDHMATNPSPTCRRWESRPTIWSSSVRPRFWPIRVSMPSFPSTSAS